MQKMYACWVEIHANRALIADPEAFRDAARRCREAGLTSMILGVKDTTGFVLYPSKLAHHYGEYDQTFTLDTDYVEQCFTILREEGLECYAAFDVFAEGSRLRPHPAMLGFQEGWACQVYGLDRNGLPKILPSTQCQELRTVCPVDDFGEIFVDPGNPEVRRYELDLIQEFAARYHPDGIVLDRVRYIGLASDFSPASRLGWERFSGETDARWPEDIYTISETPDGLKAVPGKHYGSFFCYRASILQGFIAEVAQLLKACSPQTEFCDYTGSWYPLYDQVGANWASPGYLPTEFPACDPEKLRKTAYGHIPDRLLSGFYYEDVWESSVEGRKPAYWYSVEGSWRIADKVTCGKEGLVGSLFLAQYQEHPERLTQAITLCMEKSGGCMLFDLSYILKYGWWKEIRLDLFAPLTEADLDSAAALCAQVFPSQYGMNAQKLQRCLFAAPDFSPECSFTLRNPRTGSLIGVAGVKVSQERELYPDTAWLSLLAVSHEAQGLGWGRLMLLHLDTLLRARGIRRVYAGQDMGCFFSGIPAPTPEKGRFFQHAGFTLNRDLHYDLEARVDRNPAMDAFDPTPFEKDFQLRPFRPEDASAFTQFVEDQFPGRWHMEVRQSLAEGKDPEQIVLLWNKAGTQVQGYCMLHFDPQGTSGLGPIGIASDIRGQHLGDYLLHGSLTQLRKLGAETVNIDWTILVKFYGQFGFTPKRTYLAAYQDIL